MRISTAQTKYQGAFSESSILASISNRTMLFLYRRSQFERFRPPLFVIVSRPCTHNLCSSLRLADADGHDRPVLS